MTESIPFWEDWRFWQIVVTGALAFLGFTFGTWIKHAFDLRQDRIRRDHENVVFAIAFRAELYTMLSEVKTRWHFIENRPAAFTAVVSVAQFDIPAKAVYANNTHRLGDLGGSIAGLVVYAHGHADHIRQIVASTLAYPYQTPLPPEFLPSVRRNFLELNESAAKAHNALDVFLGDPERYPDFMNLAAEADPAAAPAEPADPDAAPSP